mgnify:CR=1 FL=1
MKPVRIFIVIAIGLCGLSINSLAQSVETDEESSVDGRVYFTDPAPQFVKTGSESESKIYFQDPAPQVVITNKEGRKKGVVFSDPAPTFLEKEDDDK